MNTTAPALIAVDLDGTLLDDAEDVPQRNIDVLTAARDAGTHIVLATGRPPLWVTPITDQLGFRPLAVCANGAVVVDAHTDTVISSRLLSTELLAEINEVITRELPDAGVGAERFEATVNAHDSEFVTCEDYRHAWAEPEQSQLHRADVLSQPVFKLLVSCPRMLSKDMFQAVIPHVQDYASVTYSIDHGLIEFSALGADKGSAVSSVAKSLGVPAADCIAFGNMNNDISMLNWAGRSVAVANAEQSVLDVAGIIAPSNEECGVAHVLSTWF